MKKLNKTEIVNLLNEIKTKYYESSKLKNRDKNELYYMASAKLDAIFLQLLKDSLTEKHTIIDEVYTPYRSAFREELVLFGNNPIKDFSIDTNEFDKSLFQLQNNILFELAQYNVIRNRLEAGYLGDIEIFYDEKTKLIKTSQETDSALIARYEDAEKYCYDKKSLVKKGANHIVSYIMGCEQTILLLMMSNKYDDIKLLKEMNFPDKSTPLFLENNFQSFEKEIREIIKFAEADYTAKSDVLKNYDLGNFDLEDYKKVYCCLMALSLNKTQSCFLELIKNNLMYNPNVIWHKQKIIDFIEFFTSLPTEKIKYILETFLVFNIDFQFSDEKEYLSIYHPIFEFNDFYVINSSLTLINLAQRKLIWQINKSAEENLVYKNTISLMAHDKEKIMISEILSFLSNSHYDINQNFHFKTADKQNTDVEIDISVLDSKQKVLILIECKDHIPIDNEFERNRQDKLLISESEYRANKNKIVSNNLRLYINRAHPSAGMPDKVLSILVANHYGGSNTEGSPIPIISKATFFKLLTLHSYDLSKVYQAIINKDYIPKELKQEKVSATFLDYTIDTWMVNNKIATN